MSRSHSYSSSYSRGNRPQRSTNISVTEASFQNLQLGDTAANQHSSIPSAYSTSGHYPRASFSQGDPTTSYLSAGYDTTDFASVSPSGSFLGSQRAISPAFLDQDPVYFATDPSDFRADMSSYNYARNTTVPSSYDGQGSYPSSRSSSIPGYSYSRDASHRSTSYPFGPPILPSSVPGSLSMDDREAARQRRRQLHLSRRQSKARVRRTRLPSIPDAEPSLEENVDHLVDFPTAPSTSSSYDIPGSSQYSRTTSTSAPYLTSTSPNPYVNYTPGYVGNISPQPSYPSDPHIRSSTGMSGTGSYRAGRTAGHSVSPNPDESIRVVESPRRPQCWEHGCNGRQFSTFSNLLRHQREKSGTAAKSYCPRCGAEFTRTTARNGHMAHEKCKPRQQD